MYCQLMYYMGPTFVLPISTRSSLLNCTHVDIMSIMSWHLSMNASRRPNREEFCERRGQEVSFKQA